MKYKLLALINDAPDAPDWSILDLQHPAVVWVKSYYDTYGALPTPQLFATECLEPGEQPIATAPWKYYVKEALDVRFVQEATKYLEGFNKSYSADPKKAILALRDSFTKLNEPTKQIEPADIAAQTKERWERFALKQSARIKIGIEPFDEASGGVNPDEEFLVIGARLGQGKSLIVHKVALAIAMQGLNVGIYSGEMTEWEVGARIDTWLTHISNYGLSRGRLTDYAAQEAAYAAEVKGLIKVITPRHLGRIAQPSDLRTFVKERNLSVLVIDQLSLMQPDGQQYKEMHQQYAALSLQLKALQQELRIPIIAVTQLNRGAQEQEITAANISGSDRVGQDATCILSLERKDGELIIKVIKARSFRVPDKGWTFTWDIDTGVLAPITTAIDAVNARKAAAKKADAEAAKVVPQAGSAPTEYGRGEEDDDPGLD